jgi:hypothetical protein
MRSRRHTIRKKKNLLMSHRRKSAPKNPERIWLAGPEWAERKKEKA